MGLNLFSSTLEARSLAPSVGRKSYLDNSKDSSTLATSSFVERWSSTGPSVFAEVADYDVSKRQYVLKRRWSSSIKSGYFSRGSLLLVAR